MRGFSHLISCSKPTGCNILNNKYTAMEKAWLRLLFFLCYNMINEAINLKIVQLLCTILRFYTRMFCSQNGIINCRLNGYPFSRFYLLGQEKGER